MQACAGPSLRCASIRPTEPEDMAGKSQGPASLPTPRGAWRQRTNGPMNGIGPRHPRAKAACENIPGPFRATPASAASRPGSQASSPQIRQRQRRSPSGPESPRFPHLQKSPAKNTRAISGPALPSALPSALCSLPCLFPSAPLHSLQMPPRKGKGPHEQPRSCSPQKTQRAFTSGPSLPPGTRLAGTKSHEGQPGSPVQPFTASLRDLPGLKRGTFMAGISRISPVPGIFCLRALR